MLMGALCRLISLKPRIHHSELRPASPDSTMCWFVRKAVFAVSGWTEFHLRGQTEGDAATLEMGHFCEWRCVTTRECVCLDVFFYLFIFFTSWLLQEEWLVAKRRNICKWTPSGCFWVCESGLALVKAKAPLWTQACSVPALQHGKCLVLRRAASTFSRGGKLWKVFY